MQCFAFPEERRPLEPQHLLESKPEVLHPLVAVLLLCDVCALFSLAYALHLNQDHVFVHLVYQQMAVPNFLDHLDVVHCQKKVYGLLHAKKVF